MSGHFVLHDGVPMDGPASQVNPGADGFQFGLGVFTTIGVVGGRARWLGDHYARLSRDAAALGLGRAVGWEEFEVRCAQVIAANGIGTGGLKVLWYAEGNSVRELILSRPHGYTEATFLRGRRLRVHRCLQRGGDPLRALKSLNYAEHLLATREAKREGYDDALWVDSSGDVLETATASVFCVREGKVYTPPLAAGILRGITRNRLLSLDSGISVEEKVFPLSWALGSDEVFVANSLGLVMPVAAIDVTTFDVSANRVTRILSECLHA